MARKKIEPQKTMSLIDLIPQYGEHKAEADKLKKVCESENKDIKALMKADNLEEKESGGWVAKYIVQKRESINEDMLLEILHDNSLDDDTVRAIIDSGIVKTKQYVDFDALENAIYNHKIPNELLIEMDKAREVKEVETLRVTKKKEKKDE